MITTISIVNNFFSGNQFYLKYIPITFILSVNKKVINIHHINTTPEAEIVYLVGAETFEIQ